MLPALHIGASLKSVSEIRPCIHGVNRWAENLEFTKLRTIRLTVRHMPFITGWRQRYCLSTVSCSPCPSKSSIIAMVQDLKGKTALVTGATSGIGRYCARSNFQTWPRFICRCFEAPVCIISGGPLLQRDCICIGEARCNSDLRLSQC